MTDDKGSETPIELDRERARDKFYTLLAQLRPSQAALKGAEKSSAELARLTEQMLTHFLLSAVQHALYKTAPFCMGVGYNARAQLVLHVNLDWILGVNRAAFEVVAQHEALHIRNRDLVRGIRMMRGIPEELYGEIFSAVCNPAMDCAVNSQVRTNNPYIDDAEVMGPRTRPILPEHFELPANLPSELYFDVICDRYMRHREGRKDVVNQLRAQLKSLLDGGGGGGSPGGGGGGGQEESPDGSDGLGGLDRLGENMHVDGELAEQLGLTPEEREALEDALDNAHGAAMVRGLQSTQKQIGKLPAHMQQELDALLSVPVVPWVTLLRQYVQASIKGNVRSTMQTFKRGRYLPTAKWGQLGVPLAQQLTPRFPGRVEDNTYGILFAIDTSGSMSAEDILEALSELQGIVRQVPGCVLYVAQADTCLSHVHKMDADEDAEEYARNIGRTSFGGTTFTHVVDYASWSHTRDRNFDTRTIPADNFLVHTTPRFDALVYATDGYGYCSSQLNARCAAIWLLTRSGLSEQDFAANYVGFGRAIKLN